MKNRGFVIAIAVIALISVASVAYAVPSKVDEFLGSTADAILKFFAELSRRLVVLGSFWSRVNAIKYEVYDNLPDHLTKTLDVKDPRIAGILGYFIKIILPLYVTAIVLTGMYLIFFSGSPHGRSRAKYMLRNLLLGMFIVSLSVPIMQLLLQASSTLVESILAQGPLNIGFVYKRGIDYLNYRTADFMWSNIAVAIPLVMASLFLAAGVFIVLAIRYFMIIFLTAFFPFIIFVSMFSPTRNIGRVLIKQLFFWAFLPAGYALALITITVGSQTLAAITPEVYNILSLSGTFLLIITPLAMFGLMDWLSVLATPFFALLLSAPPVTVAESEKRRKRVEDATPAVGVRGYERAEGKKKLVKKRKHTSLELAGLEEAPEEPGTGEEEEREEGGYFPGMAKQGPSPTYGYAAAEAGEGPGAAPPHTRQTITAELRRNAPLVVIPPKAMPYISMELTEGDSETLNFIVRNEGDAPLRRVFIYDQELEEAGFTLTYSENLFNLNQGEEKLIKVKISSGDKMQPKSYIGTIAFKTEKGLHSWLDVTIKTKEKTAAATETREEAHVAFGYKTKDAAAKKQETPKGARATIAQRVRMIQEQEEPIFESVPEKKAAGKAKIDRTLTGLFGESEEKPPEKKQEPAPPRTGFGPSTPRVSDSTLTSFFGTTKEPIPEKKEEPAPPKPPAPKVEEPPQTPAPPAPAPAPPQKEEPKPSEPAPTLAPEPPKPAPSTPVPETTPTPKPKYVEPEPAPAPEAPAPPQQEPPGRRVGIVKKQVEEVEKRLESIGALEMMKPLLSLIRPAKPGKFLRRKKQ